MMSMKNGAMAFPIATRWARIGEGEEGGNKWDKGVSLPSNKK
jgi:hypothetical protein